MKTVKKSNTVIEVESAHAIVFLTFKKNKDKQKEGYLISAEGTIVKSIGVVDGICKINELHPAAMGKCLNTFCFNPSMVCVDPLHTVEEITLGQLDANQLAIFQQFIAEDNAKAQAICGAFGMDYDGNRVAIKESFEDLKVATEKEVSEVEARMELLGQILVRFKVSSMIPSKGFAINELETCIKLLKEAPSYGVADTKNIKMMAKLVEMDFNEGDSISQRLSLAQALVKNNLMSIDLFEGIVPLSLLINEISKKLDLIKK